MKGHTFEVRKVGGISRGGAWDLCKKQGAKLGVPQHAWRADHTARLWRWYSVDVENPPPEEESKLAEARAMVGTWFQVSRKHRIVARLPEGKTGIEALIEGRLGSMKLDELEPDTRAYWEEEIPRWAKMLGESSAGDHYLRVYARSADLWRTLSRQQFDAYRKAGGDTYRSAKWRSDVR